MGQTVQSCKEKMQKIRRHAQKVKKKPFNQLLHDDEQVWDQVHVDEVYQVSLNLVKHLVIFVPPMTMRDEN